MKIRFLGAHSTTSARTGCTSILIDDILAVDAGALAGSLSFEEQARLQAVLLTHQHYDHLRDIPTLGMNLFLLKQTLTLYMPQPVYELLTAHLLNDVLYPDYFKRPPEKPIFKLVIIEAGKSENIAGYEVLPVPVKHAVPTVGCRITAADGKQVFITSDTGPGLAECWQQVSPQILVIELTSPDKDKEASIQHGHLTPSLLQKELESFREIKGYLPQVVVMHLNPLDENEIKAEISGVEKALKIKIRFAREGMIINV
ncbi:MAG: MBL fold metallo-hydrolase [Dehalococcoidales bacterium]